MYVNVAILKETVPHERRVALVPSVIPKLIKLGAKLHMQSGAGDAIHLTDDMFKDVDFIDDRKELVSDADVVLSVQPPALEVIDAMKAGAILICFIYADKEKALVHRLLEKKITCFAMERIPRITRAQSMDALSSQSALAGYYAVGLGINHLTRILPKITTAAGAIGPAKVLVMGLGVAGLEAIATAHRLGAVVEGYDVRPETEEQALSLGATFVETGVDARGKGGYARELTPEEKKKVADVLTKHIQQSDLVITTAAIPGNLLTKIDDPNIKKYIEESLKCLQVGALRACIVFVWSGAIRTIQNKTLTTRGAVLNAAIIKHDPKARKVSRIDDFAYIKDSVVLLAAKELGILDKPQKDTLEEALNLRNRCGHPGKYHPGIKKASSFIEDVISIVFS